MLELKKTPEHTIDRVFLLALLALFAATAFLVVSIGACLLYTSSFFIDLHDTA